MSLFISKHLFVFLETPVLFFYPQTMNKTAFIVS